MLDQGCLRAPKGPSHTKNTTESEFRLGEEIRYEEAKSYRESSEMLAFPRQKKGRKTVQTVLSYAAKAKYYGFGRCSIFRTEWSSGPFLENNLFPLEVEN